MDFDNLCVFWSFGMHIFKDSLMMEKWLLFNLPGSTETSLKTVLVVSDGLGDHPIPSLRGKTPLEAARTPTLDKLADEGTTGLVHVIAPGIPPGSDAGHLALLGYDPKSCYTGRGAFEALGAGISLQPTDIAFRGNFATVQSTRGKELRILDRRAGRHVPEGDELAKLVNRLSLPSSPDIEVIVKRTAEHRCVVILRGANLSQKIGDTDSHSRSDYVQKSIPLDSSEAAQYTASVVNELTREFHRILSASPINAERRKSDLPEANIVLLRGAGTLPEISSLKDLYGIRAACVAGGALYKGVARSVGMDILPVPGATAGYDTNAEAKAKAAAKTLSKHDFVFLHFKPTDSAAHDKNPQKKIEMTEKLDHLLSTLQSAIDRENTLIAITSDHSTSSLTGKHIGDPVPLLINGPRVRNDVVTRFSERACANGGLGHIVGKDLMPILMNYVGRTPKYGA